MSTVPSPPAYEGWTPVVEEATDVVTPPPRRLHGLLDAPGPPPGAGDPLPALWHWLAFLPDAAQADLGADGHPRRGGFLPPVALPRRMFVGGRVDQPGTLSVGEALHRTGRVTRIRATEGRSGALVFVTVRYEISGAGGPALVEEQDLVYRDPPPAATPSASPPAPDPPAPDAWPWLLEVPIDPTVLFRFSALTYNAHRIHYDRGWATGAEGYPGLVVHGPLQAIAMAELCRRHRPGRPIRSWQFTAVAPAFDDGPLVVGGRPGPDDLTVELQARSVAGRVSAHATARVDG